MMVFSGMKQLVISPYFYIEVPSSPITDKKARVVQPLLSIYQDLGLSDQEAKQLNYNLRLQHALVNGGKTIKEMYNEDSVKGTSSYNNAKENYKNVVYVNFKENESAKKIFDYDLNVNSTISF